MKKNILIIGYGDIGHRLSARINKQFNLYALSRSPVMEEGITHYSWDWLSGKVMPVQDISFEAIIFIPKPSEMSEKGYLDGFITALKNIQKSLPLLEFKKFISISSTRVFGSNQKGKLTENDLAIPNDFRGNIIKEYESMLIDYFKDNLNILRFSGLYDTSTDKLPFNRLHRDSAAKIIDFFINKSMSGSNTNIIHCCEDKEVEESSKCISNIKLKKLGFTFDY